MKTYKYENIAEDTTILLYEQEPQYRTVRIFDKIQYVKFPYIQFLFVKYCGCITKLLMTASKKNIKDKNPGFLNIFKNQDSFCLGSWTPTNNTIDWIDRFWNTNFRKENICEDVHHPEETSRIDFPDLYFHFMRSEYIINRTLVKNGMAILDLENPTEDMKMLAVMGNFNVINFLENPSEALKMAAHAAIIKALTADGLEIDKVYSPTEEMMLIAVAQNPNAIACIKNPSLEAQRIAVGKDALVIGSIRNPSVEIQKIAIRQNPYAVFEFANWDAEALASVS